MRDSRYIFFLLISCLMISPSPFSHPRSLASPLSPKPLMGPQLYGPNLLLRLFFSPLRFCRNLLLPFLRPFPPSISNPYRRHPWKPFSLCTLPSSPRHDFIPSPNMTCLTNLSLLTHFTSSKSPPPYGLSRPSFPHLTAYLTRAAIKDSSPSHL